MRFLNGFGLFALALAAGIFGAAVPAVHAMPVDGGLGLQEAVTPVMHDIIAFHNLLLWIITAIVLFVLALLIVVMVRFNRRANPTPSKTTHNTLLEVAWTVLPVMILVVIAIPSFRLLYKEIVVPEADLTVKAVGYQWYWGYEYPDNGDISLISNMVEDADLEPGQPRLFAADEAMVVPVDTTVRVIVTAADVIHAFAVPQFGVKVDAIPGRLNETWFRAEKTGMYYGQCSELCGTRHAFMPINVRVVTQEEFEQWTEQQQADAGSGGNIKVAEVAGAEAR
ncbi:MAG: cytochrome c oxidase subunit II [Parvibaculum sp.]|jgi:cytochrome c oxidase subunit 2|nr:cytochrome c oxidase subunit II [Parvibaculum sp.]MBO6678390.1 cytochrome c oxidase subunit II [Parvibaculum sp.]MBO6684147.1 cytochrome c oxidase subunit II [Parvibaculum sp.]MBO6906135.1 cytochrome c oxidase subunit II [Parvibaculum sp.]